MDKNQLFILLFASSIITSCSKNQTLPYQGKLSTFYQTPVGKSFSTRVVAGSGENCTTTTITQTEAFNKPVVLEPNAALYVGSVLDPST